MLDMSEENPNECNNPSHFGRFLKDSNNIIDLVIIPIWMIKRAANGIQQNGADQVDSEGNEKRLSKPNRLFKNESY